MFLLMLACNGPGPADTADPVLADCDAREFAPTDDQVAVIEGNAAFAADLYNTMGEGNAFFSPLSISAAFGMTSAGTAGNTQTELYDVLHVDIEPSAWHAAWASAQFFVSVDAKYQWPSKNVQPPTTSLSEGGVCVAPPRITWRCRGSLVEDKDSSRAASQTPTNT